MQKTHSKRERLNSLRSRVNNQKLGDVTLAEFADSNIPNGKGRLRKSKNVLREVRKISTSKDVNSEDVNCDNFSISSDNEDESQSETISQASKKENEEFEDNEKFTFYPLKIWLLIADYIPPEDVKSFSLTCKATNSVVNTPLFWIRLYKRCYKKKTSLPECLSYKFLSYQLGLKQRVVRSLYYFYSPFVKVATSYSPSTELGVGRICLHQWTYSIRDKIVLNEFIVLPKAMGMRLKSLVSSQRSTALTFSSAPLLRKPTEAGSIHILLEHSQKPRLIPWWHPDYWEHGRCCRIIRRA